MDIRTFKDLKVWKKSYDLAVEVYKATKLFPSEEKFGITSQIRRAVVGISSNIAEGYARGYLKQYIQFLYVAYSSGAELETQLMLAKDFGYLTKERFDGLMERYYEVERMLKGLINSLERKIVYKNP